MRGFETITIPLLVLSVTAGITTAMDQRGMEHLTRCVKMAEPLVQNPEYIFPLTDLDIRGVCRMWDGFVECVHDYTKTYLTLLQQHEFNRAIQSSIDSIHQLCAGEPDYRRSYIAYAPCLKRVSVEDGFCGGQYRYLADLVQGTTSTDAQLCCAHHKFRDCVLDKTPVECDREGVASGTSIAASLFMRDMLNRALGFLLQKCRNFVPNARDCPKTNLEVTTGTTWKPSDADSSDSGNGYYSYNTNGNNNNNNNNNYDLFNNGLSSSSHNDLRPDSTTSRISSTLPPVSTTRFTWTTKGSGLSTTSSSNIDGNGLEPESQQYRGGASVTLPGITSLVAISLTLVLT
ncbi:hypothetical protein SK128_005212 [Halocaridina rubra]|uniref:Uncharacterized protein n=1 Tax=Halocaridina rubra TaxID=373956 RepID=A0AAN8WNZ1_HALRR